VPDPPLPLAANRRSNGNGARSCARLLGAVRMSDLNFSETAFAARTRPERVRDMNPPHLWRCRCVCLGMSTGLTITCALLDRHHDAVASVLWPQLWRRKTCVAWCSSRPTLPDEPIGRDAVTTIELVALSVRCCRSKTRCSVILCADVLRRTLELAQAARTHRFDAIRAHGAVPAVQRIDLRRVRQRTGLHSVRQIARRPAALTSCSY